MMLNIGHGTSQTWMNDKIVALPTTEMRQDKPRPDQNRKLVALPNNGPQHDVVV